MENSSTHGSLGLHRDTSWGYFLHLRTAFSSRFCDATMSVLSNETTGQTLVGEIVKEMKLCENIQSRISKISMVATVSGKLETQLDENFDWSLRSSSQPHVLFPLTYSLITIQK